MTPDQSAVVLSVLTTAGVGLAGTAIVAALPRRRPVTAAIAAPFVVVASLAAGVAVATRQMLIDDNTAQTLLIVLVSCGPLALLVGLVLARRVRALERAAAEERADQQRAREVEASRRETIRWLSHDLRTPLAGIRALAEASADDALDETPARIMRETDRLDAMVDDIVELSRLHSDRRREITSVALDDLVSDAVSSVAPLAEAEGVRIQAGALSADTIAGEARELTRAITNIVRNAVQYSPAGSVVTVATATDGGHAVVAVTDACGGIRPEDLPHLLEPGWRSDRARSQRGMGLGLAIADEVARAHGGRVRIDGVAPAAGCTVRLLLPVPAAAELTDS